MKALDLSAGHRAMRFERDRPDVTFVDHRPVVSPNIVADTRALPRSGYQLLVFRPSRSVRPHLRYGQGLWQLQQSPDYRYGKADCQRGASSCGARGTDGAQME